MRARRFFTAALLLALCACLAAGCGGGSDKALLESEKKLAGMYQACKTIELTDGDVKKTVSTDGLSAIGTIRTTAVLKRSNGMTRTDEWEGTPLGSVLDANGITRPFKELRMEAWDGYVGRVPYEVAVEPRTMLAFRTNGRRIPREDGPVRLVVPSQDGFYWIRMITRIEVLR